jgi:hypothetical protein
VSQPPPLALATLQRQLRDLIHGRSDATTWTDPYLENVAQSAGLQVVREIVHWWRAVGLERSCVLTVAALKRQGTFDETVAAFIRDQGISPYVEELAQDFLVAISSHDDALIATLAKFELALRGAKLGDRQMHVIAWPGDPIAIMNALMARRPLDVHASRAAYETVVSSEVPGLFYVRTVTS